MTEAEFQIVKSIGFVGSFALAVGLQHWSPHRRLVGSWRVNGGLWALNAVLLGLVCAGCACTVSRWASSGEVGLLNQGVVSTWTAVAVSVVGLDFVSYLWHRANHRVPLLWRLHQAHHSDPDYRVTTALRFHPGELLLALPIRLSAVALLGVPIHGVIVFEVVFAFANFFEHGNINLPLRLERTLGGLFITPALHRRHHGRKRQLLDTNFGTIFSFWDRLLGSYGDNRSNLLVETGLPGLEQPLGVVDLLVLPVRGSFRGS